MPVAVVEEPVLDELTQAATADSLGIEKRFSCSCKRDRLMISIKEFVDTIKSDARIPIVILLSSFFIIIFKDSIGVTAIWQGFLPLVHVCMLVSICWIIVYISPFVQKYVRNIHRKRSINKELRCMSPEARRIVFLALYFRVGNPATYALQKRGMDEQARRELVSRLWAFDMGSRLALSASIYNHLIELRNDRPHRIKGYTEFVRKLEEEILPRDPKLQKDIDDDRVIY